MFGLSDNVEAVALVKLWESGQNVIFEGVSGKSAMSQPKERIMSTTESLRLLFDNANGEIQRLEAKNWRVWEAHSEQVAKTELSTEVERLK